MLLPRQAEQARAGPHGSDRGARLQGGFSLRSDLRRGEWGTAMLV